MRGGAGGSLRGQSSTAPGEEAGLGQSRRGARAGIPAPGGGWAGAVPRWLRAAGAPPGRPMSPPASTPRREAIDFAALIDRFSLAQGRRGTSDRHRKDIGARAGGTGPPPRRAPARRGRARRFSQQPPGGAAPALRRLLARSGSLGRAGRGTVSTPSTATPARRRGDRVQLPVPLPAPPGRALPPQPLRTCGVSSPPVPLLGAEPGIAALCGSASPRNLLARFANYIYI